jgi:hypothetical protein
MQIFRHIFLSNYWWHESDIWSQASYWYPISWEVFLDPSDSYFLFADFVDFYTHWTYILYMPIFSCIFLINYWRQKSDIWSQAFYRYPISWEAFYYPSDSYFLFAEEREYHKWALAHSSSCFKSVHVSNLFWSREYNIAKEICKYASFSKVRGNYPLDLKIIWSSAFYRKLTIPWSPCWSTWALPWFFFIWGCLRTSVNYKYLIN